jgi:hypothetical protein
MIQSSCRCCGTIVERLPTLLLLVVNRGCDSNAFASWCNIKPKLKKIMILMLVSVQALGNYLPSTAAA